MNSKIKYSAKNVLLRILVFLFNLCRGVKNEGNQKHLVVSTTAMGDTLWATPAIAALRGKYRTAHIAVLAGPIGAKILQNNPHIDQIHIFEKPFLKSFLKQLFILRKERFENIYIFHTSQRLVMPLCAMLGAKNIIASAKHNKDLDCFASRLLASDNEHEICRRLNLTDTQQASKKMHMFITCEEKNEAAKYFQNNRLNICLHPGANDSYKCYPAKYYVQLGHLLQKEYEANIFVSGAPHEKELVCDIAQKIPKAQTLFLSLREFAAFIDRADLLITNDTGPFHLATALETPALAPYIPTNPALCGPLDAPLSRAVLGKQTCDPCKKHLCATPLCFLQITPAIMLNAIKKLLGVVKQ